jgi:uncharacterized protein YciI
MVRFLYFYVMKDHPDRIRAIAPGHAAYWQGLDLDGYLGGPFLDRSGGLILFHGESLEHARGLVAGDPFLREDLLRDHWVKAWVPETPDRTTGYHRY